MIGECIDIQLQYACFINNNIDNNDKYNYSQSLKQSFYNQQIENYGLCLLCMFHHKHNFNYWFPIL